MKNEENRARRDKIASVVLLIGTIAVIALISTLLLVAIRSIDGADGENKTSPGAPESLVSLGAPRSQLELERTFSSIADEYVEDGLRVYEPITRPYRDSVEKRIEAGEGFALSVEEVLYLISDSIEAYEKYDVIRLVESYSAAKDVAPVKELASASLPYYDAANTKARDILEIIIYRILSLSSPDRVTRTEEHYVYMPQYKGKGEGTFEIVRLDAPDVSTGIVFNAENGSSVRLYPSDKIINDCLSTVLCESRRVLSRAEREVLTRSGYDAEACRNVTPEYFYGRTSLRLVATGGRIIVVDIEKISATDPLPREERFTSAALTEGGICITSARADGSSVWKYETGVGEKFITSLDEAQVGAYNEDGEISFYAVRKIDSKKYISVLVRSGDPIMKLDGGKEKQ